MRHSKNRSKCICIVTLQIMFIQSLGGDLLTPPTACQSTHRPAFWAGAAPVLPQLPPQYSMKVEANILQNSWTTEVEEHYDSINQRASVSLTRNGSTLISIFNFKDTQRYDIYPDGTCVTQSSLADFLGFVTINKQNRPVMATVNEVFRFGTQFNVTYIGQENVRGIIVNHWTSCQIWAQHGAKFQLEYYFSDQDFTTAGGHVQIPVRAVLIGSAHNVDTSNNQIKGMHTFQHIYEFTSFRSGPALNEDVFQIPPGIVCSGRNNNKPPPQIPNQLEMSLEIVTPDRSVGPKEEHLRYDFNDRLQETIRTSVGVDGSKQLTSTSVIMDYQNGLVYSTDLTSMSCIVQKMPTGMSSTTVSMSHGQNLLAVANDNRFVYQGETTFRRIPVDVWAMEYSGVVTEIYFMSSYSGIHLNQSVPMVGMFIKNRTSIDTTDLPKMLQDVLQSAITIGSEYNVENRDDRSSSSDSPTGDQLAWGLQLERMLDQHTSQKIVNIFHYSPLHLDTSSFQVSQCYPESEISQIGLFLLASYEKDVRGNFLGFVNSLRNVLAQKISCSILHISNLVLSPVKLESVQYNVTKATFALLGSTNVQSEVQQKSVLEVKEILKMAIHNGITFRVHYPTFYKDFDVHRTMYFIEYVQHQTQNNTNCTFFSASQPSSRELPRFSSSEPKYSHGAVAGIAIGSVALGALLCLVISFLVYKKRMKLGVPLFQHHDTM